MLGTSEILAIIISGAALVALLALIVTAAWQAYHADFRDEPFLKWAWLIGIIAAPLVGAGAWMILRLNGSPWTGARRTTF
ncbi:ABC-type Fe3+ transport system permease subunit [Arthrobacter woluwensis]|uniref:PLDc N-terminal domain-containing protein n=1 Tax=Arthrobacter woluwensis TaxID=156980 RepID=UPI0027865A36|nr:PLDc N-terminal domain-containing protein [Arthrobacter woluwensis]MDQ0707676.1 ABC-type Fe3+ transport system permease subunit [Arthrobacter woluwensis]